MFFFKPPQETLTHYTTTMMIDSPDPPTLEQQQQQQQQPGAAEHHRVSSMLGQNSSASNDDSHSTGNPRLQAAQSGCNSSCRDGGGDGSDCAGQKASDGGYGRSSEEFRTQRKKSGCAGGGNDAVSGECLRRKISGCGGNDSSAVERSPGQIASGVSGGNDWGEFSPPSSSSISTQEGGAGLGGVSPQDSPLTSPEHSPMRGGLQWSRSALPSISEEDVMTMMEGRNLQEIMSDMPPCQCDACLLDGDGDGEGEGPRAMPALKRQSSWKKIRSIVRWSPFIQVFKKHRYPWIQLAGHQGNFQAGEAGCVLKKLDAREHRSVQMLMEDSLQLVVPCFRGVVERDGELYIQLQDLLCEFNSPYVMDVKMGVRTFLETEIHAAKQNPKLRKDMYKKMMEVDPQAPTEEERAQMAVTKHRYMQWRDAISSSASLGFRIEGIKSCDGTSNKDFKQTKTRDDVTKAFRAFFGDSSSLLSDYVQRLQLITRTQELSDFFRSHELIGSSLLFVHDDGGAVGVWMIDFGKTQPLPDGVTVDHRTPWTEGNHEDGYLLGVDNIISILRDLQAACVK